MDESQEHAAYSVHLRAEHRRLNEAIQRIRRDWPLRQAAESAAAIERTVESLADLREVLAKHFREEEEGGCLEEAVCRCPSLGHKADQLEGEHAPLLVELDGIIGRLQAAGQSFEAAHELRREFDSFAQKLHAHEQAENVLLENAFSIPVE